MSDSWFIIIYRIKLEKRIKQLKIELEDVDSKVDIETKTPYELYVKKLELEGAIEVLEIERIESKMDTNRNLNDKFYMRRFEVERVLKALEKEKNALKS